MELRHLRYFTTVAEQLHFGRAAEKLNIVQSALSRQIQDLENELQLALFIRDSRNVRLTEAGTLFYEEAKAILSKSDRAVQLVKTLAQGYAGRLRIGFVGIAGVSGILQAFLADFRSRYPQLLIELIEAENHVQIRRLKEGELDAAIVTFAEEEPDALESFTLHASRWVIGMSTASPLAGFAELSAAQLHDESFILYGNPQAESTQRALIASFLSAEPRIVNYANSTLSTLTLIAAGYGIALVPESMRQVGVPGITFRPLAGLNRTVDIRICTLRHGASPQVGHLLSALQSFCRGRSRPALADLSAMVENGRPDTRGAE
ncbi:LysR substrate-binding domain-containing protein [uncultured Pluralibacter sp.]|uniref:LysR substrate-binding domain-containing protein n=1 Tax=uncultured Pluralibacter sp. TaxID=1490864 RepID=UPI002637297F|nr:LysR substrate-binding domain-containing protein [uncultured Pluralibacter sp.]